VRLARAALLPIHLPDHQMIYQRQIRGREARSIPKYLQLPAFLTQGSPYIPAKYPVIEHDAFASATLAFPVLAQDAAD
jgi:hypothetical protein